MPKNHLISFGAAVALVAALCLASCSILDSNPAGTTAKAAPWEPPAEQDVLFEVSHVNFAWGYYLGGFYIDRDGDIFAFGRDNDDERWQPADPDHLTAQDLQNKYSIGRTLVGSVDLVTLDLMTDLIPIARDGELSEPVSLCADYGGRSWRAYVMDESTGEYESVLLYAAGDWASRNLSYGAAELVNWLRNLNGESGQIDCGCSN